MYLERIRLSLDRTYEGLKPERRVPPFGSANGLDRTYEGLKLSVFIALLQYDFRHGLDRTYEGLKPGALRWSS